MSLLLSSPDEGGAPQPTEDPRDFPMSIYPTATAAAASRTHSRHDLARFYRAIGIPAVASAAQAARMTAPKVKTDAIVPAFLREAHAVG
jgi:hypothetical protein